MNVVCVVVDRLHWGYLGCYGNTWVATPAFDRLAAEGFVFAQALTDSTDLNEAYESLWRGSHQVERRTRPHDPPRPTVMELARRAGLRTMLVTDEPIVAEHAAGAAFDETAELAPPPAECSPATDPAATFTARLVAEAIDRLGAAESPTLLWLHARGLSGPWDAPTEFRNKFAEEDDPTPPEFTAVPHVELSAGGDLDERFGYAQAYAGQVALVDLCLAGLLEQLDETAAEHETAVVLLSPRGIVLGEHGRVGPFDDRLHGELVQIPLLVRLPGGRGRLRRSQALVQPCDVYHTIADLLGQAGANEGSAGEGTWGRSLLPLIDDPTTPWRDVAVVAGPDAAGEIGIRTRAWYLRKFATDPGDDAGAGDHGELFAKPDDAWEATDVADRAASIVEGIAKAERATRAALAAGEPTAPLDYELLHGLN